MASFYWWNIEWYKKNETEDLDSSDSGKKLNLFSR